MLVNVKKPPWPPAHMNTLALTPLGGNETNLGKRRENKHAIKMVISPGFFLESVFCFVLFFLTLHLIL